MLQVQIGKISRIDGATYAYGMPIFCARAPLAALQLRALSTRNFPCASRGDRRSSSDRLLSLLKLLGSPDLVHGVGIERTTTQDRLLGYAFDCLRR